MPNLFQTPPDLDKDFPRVVDVWTDPITGIKVPKDPTANLEWRLNLLELADNDPDLQVDLYTASSQSILFFVNAFCFTLRIFETNAEGEKNQAEHSHLPFVTWEIQDRHILAIQEAIDKGKPLLTDKSRDMGATWDHLAVYTHRFLFAKKLETHLLLSRKEDCVDLLDGMPRDYPQGALADPGTLFGKIDYIMSRLPEWMLPRMSRKKMHLSNLDNRCRIDGESTNASAGSADRRTSIFLDEMAKMDEGESIWRSTADVSVCRLPCSTPNGAGTAYSKVRMSGSIPVFIMAWWEHPEKGANRKIDKDELGRYFITSPWYEREKLERTPKELAIEVDMDHVGSGELFFESNIIEQHRQLFAKPPQRKIKLSWDADMSDKAIREAIRQRNVAKVKIGPVGDLNIWTTLIQGRPDQTRTYTLGVDLGKGQGASNSVISILCNETRMKIGELASATIPAYEFAKLVCAVAIWCGGRKRPLVIWENNGDPGADFGHQFVQIYQYPNIFFDKTVGSSSQKRAKRYGWNSNRQKKAVGLGLLRRAYSRGQFINPSERALDEALMYVHYDNGGIGPALLQTESESARATHGDRVIADMLCVIGRDDMPRPEQMDQRAKEGTFAHRMNTWKKERKAKKSWRYLNLESAA